MCEALNALDGGLKKNRCVRIGPKGGGWITLTPLDAQPDPPNLTALKTMQKKDLLRQLQAQRRLREEIIFPKNAFDGAPVSVPRDLQFIPAKINI
jgi:hypothetical protein